MFSYHERGMALAAVLAGFAPPAAVAAGFTEEQATSGRSLYNSQCAQCHGRELEGTSAPALTNEAMQNFSTAAGLHDFISVTMPPQTPGELAEESYVDIIAYILYFNGAQPGDEELTSDHDDLAQIDLVAATSELPETLEETDENQVAESDPEVPQAFTFGMNLPGSERTDGGDGAQDDPADAAVPQAFTYGADLPTVEED